MGPSRLPAELTDRIIDFCHNDKKTLSNCALTHSSWLAASRFHLFHTLSTTGAFEKTDRAIQLKSILQTRRYTISRGWPSILPYIRTVKIELSFTYNGGARLINAAHLADTICCLLYLVDLPSPSVHVSLSQPSQFLLSPAHALRSFPPVSHNVTFVRLSGVTFTHPNDIWPFLSSFPRLQYLELESVGFNKSADSSLPAESLFDGIPLTTMRLATASMGLVIRGLVRAASSLSHLEDFGIAYQDLRQGEVSQLVDSIQRRVKCLRFSSSCYPGDERNGESRPSVFDIKIPEFVGRFRSLETFVLDDLRVDGSSRYGGSDVSFEWITGVLQQLSSPVRKLVFEVIATDRSQLNAIPWVSIDRVVTSEIPQFRTLTRVEVLVKRGVRRKNRPSSIGRDAVCSEIARRLFAVNFLGLLRCDTVGCE